jgi:hypothetical protein
MMNSAEAGRVADPAISGSHIVPIQVSTRNVHRRVASDGITMAGDAEDVAMKMVGRDDRRFLESCCGFRKALTLHVGRASIADPIECHHGHRRQVGDLHRGHIRN